MAKQGLAAFDKSLFSFLGDLARNNDRDWFNGHKQQYEDRVVRPVMSFIDAFRPRLEKISPHFVAATGKSGGSMMRIYRDVRFSKNKAPYKTNVGIQFRHELGTQDAGDTEIGHLGRPVPLQQDVPGHDIAVDHSPRVGVVERPPHGGTNAC